MTDQRSNTRPMLKGFLSDHNSREEVVSITIEPEVIYFEEARDSINLNFDFVIRGLSERRLEIRFIKVAVYDAENNLLTFRHLNHNGVGTPSIHTIGRYVIENQETLDVFNPFYSFPTELPIDYLRYMFTFYEPEIKKEYYYGNVVVKPVTYNQKVRLTLPLKGLLTVLDGHDFYSHHRRFAMSIVRDVTQGRFTTNFSRYAVDFTVLGPKGNTRALEEEDYKTNYDFHFSDVTKFHTHGVMVYAPAEGEVVGIVNHLEDLYEAPFNLDEAIERDRVVDLVGNYIIIEHNTDEFSHLFHLMKDSVEVVVGEKIERGQPIARIGFSGAATLYSHLHYQLMDGKDFLNDNPLPCKFSNTILLRGSKQVQYEDLVIDTGDFVVSRV